MQENAIENEKDQFNPEWLESYKEDFKKRFLSLLSYEFRDVDVQLSLGVVDPTFITEESESSEKTAIAGVQANRVFKTKV